MTMPSISSMLVSSPLARTWYASPFSSMYFAPWATLLASSASIRSPKLRP